MIADIVWTARNLRRHAAYPLIHSCILFAAVILVLLTPASSFGKSIPDSTKVVSPGGYAALLDKLVEKGTVRIIVKLKVDFQPMADIASAESLQQIDRIAGAQDAFLGSLIASKPRAVHKYRYIPYLYLDVDETSLMDVLASSRIVDVQEDIPDPPGLDFSVPRIGAPLLWGTGYTGTGMVAAVLDTGVDKNHPFLAGSVISEACYSSYDASINASSVCPGGVTESTAVGSALPYGGNCPAGQCDHGTHVAGIIAGRQSVSGAPGPGVAPAAGVIAIQVFTRFEDYCGYPCALSYVSDQIKGLERVYALRSTYSISSVNMSLGGGSYTSNCDSDARKAIIDSLKAAGIATIISTGNSGFCDSMGAPACISSAVSVGATTDDDAVADYSNSASFQSLLAPGSSINSSIPGDLYASWNGTSMAAPHVTGAWALLKQAKPSATVNDVLAAFTATGVSIHDSGKCSSVTKKRINVNEALHYLAGTVSGVTIAANKSTPQQVGAQITFTAAASGGSGSYEYQFRLRNPSGVWSVARDYSSTSSWTWNTTNLAIGKYYIEVWARNAGSTAAWEAYKTMSFTLSPPAMAVTLTSNAASPQSLGNRITFTAAASGGSGSYEYQFRLYNPFSESMVSGWYVARPYNTMPSWTWDTTDWWAGKYYIEVWARSVGSTAAWEAYKNMSFTLLTPASAVTLSANAVSPQSVGNKITFTAAASGGSGSYEYLYKVRNPAGVWSVTRTYSAEAAWTWNTAGLATGTYKIEVWTKNAGSNAAWEAYKNMSYTLRLPVTAVSLNSDKPSPQARGTAITFTASATGTTESYVFQFRLRTPSGVWSIVRDYSSTPSWTWNTSVGQAAGGYLIEVWAKNTGSSAAWEAYRNTGFTLQ